MYANLQNIVGAPVGQFSGLVADTTPQLLPGTIMPMVDPWWGYGELLYFRAAGVIPSMAAVALTPTFDSSRQSFRYDGIAAPDVANSGRMICIAMRPMAVGEYSWGLVSGLTPVRGNANLAADSTCGLTASTTGTIGAATAGRQLLNSRVAAPSTTTVIKNGVTAPVGSLVLQVPNSDGWFIGATLSGAGIAGGTTVTGMDPSGRNVSISAATTAAVSTVTATYSGGGTNFNVIHLNRPFLQGIIT